MAEMSLSHNLYFLYEKSFLFNFIDNANKSKVIRCVSIGTLIQYVMPKVQNTISIFLVRG